MNIETFINNTMIQLQESNNEDQKILKDGIKVKTKAIGEQRKDRIKNLEDQMKSFNKSGACFKAIRASFAMIDFLAKPLSLITFNKLNLRLTQTLDALQKVKAQGKKLGLEIKGMDITQTLEQFKKLLSTDIQKLGEKEAQISKEANKTLQIIEDLEKTLQSTLI